MTRSRRADQAAATREALLDAAERLFAEHGVHGVGIRQISQAADQGNNTAVSYHFGSKTGLIRAIIRRHADAIERLRGAMIAELGDDDDLRAWLACAVAPVTAYLDTLGQPSWYARFIAHITADPELRAIADEQFSAAAGRSSNPLQEGLYRCVPGLPDDIRAERSAMTGHLINQTVAARERELADGAPTVRQTWADCATGLIDALVGLWRAPVTTTMP